MEVQVVCVCVLVETVVGAGMCGCAGSRKHWRSAVHCWLRGLEIWLTLRPREDFLRLLKQPPLNPFVRDQARLHERCT